MHHNHSTTHTTEGPSLLASLRALMPDRPLRLHEALVIAERQADRLLRLQGSDDVPVPTSIVTGGPRIHVSYDNDLPEHAASGSSTWDSRQRAWIISINPSEPRTRQRFTVLHEYKHIVDHYHPGLTGRLPQTYYGLPPVEYVADYFAGCVLMPKRTLKRAYYDGIQNPRDLAELFDVSPRAIEVRLAQLGLADRPQNHRSDPASPTYRLQPIQRPIRYYRDRFHNRHDAAHCTEELTCRS